MSTAPSLSGFPESGQQSLQGASGASVGSTVGTGVAVTRAGRLDAKAADAVLMAAGHRATARRRAWPAGLSEREVVVLRLVSRGLTNRDIGEQLSLSESTVHHHVLHIYGKISVSTRAAATLFALQHDMLDAVFS